jgi:hypothetical protein
MRYSIEPREGYLYASVAGRDTAAQMREFLLALHAACRQHGCPRVLISIRQSRAMFKPEDYGLGVDRRGYANELVTPECRIALVGDTEEVNSANEYIEVVARQQGVNVCAFRDVTAAARWMSGEEVPNRRYRFTRIVIAGAPDDAGVYVLWDGDEPIYYGRTPAGTTIRALLLEHYHRRVDAATYRATHYSWELCKDPAAREAELLREHQRAYGRLPRCNAA